MRLIFLVLLGTAIAGSYIAANRQNMGKTAQQAAIWVLIFIGTISAIGLWEDLRGDVSSGQSVQSDGRIEVPIARDGQYNLTLQINGVDVDFIVDTGASQVVLTQVDARRIGLSPEDLNYFGSASTANGIVRTAPVQLSTVRLGDRTDRNVPAVVNAGDMNGSLLGMTYLGLFDRIEIANNRLVLTR